MKYILDTHTLLWVLFEDEKLSEKAKVAIKKLELQGIVPEELPKKSKEINIETLEISEEEASSFYHLPRQKHKDPFDRLIIWQAINRKMPLISKDKPIKEYQKFGLEIMW